MILIDMEMPVSCDECPARDEYNACAFFELRGHEDWCSNFMRPDSCPLKEADDKVMSLREKIQELEKKLHDVGASPFDAQIGRE